MEDVCRAVLHLSSAHEPSSPSVCPPWLHLGRSQVWPWRGTWLAVTAIAEQVHHAPGDTHTRATATVRRAQTLIYQSKGTFFRELLKLKARRQKSFAKERFQTVCRFLVHERESSEKWSVKENYTWLLYQLCFQNVGWVNGSARWDFCWNFHSTLWGMLQQRDRKQVHEVVWIRALGTLERFIKETSPFACSHHDLLISGKQAPSDVVRLSIVTHADWVGARWARRLYTRTCTHAG